MKTTERKNSFKPLTFPWAYEFFLLQNNLHWKPEEVSMLHDIQDFNGVLSPHERTVISQILKFFTQTDVEVARCYLDYYIPIFKNVEIRMMLSTFAAMEAIHIHSYSFLLTSLHLPDSMYSEFLQYKEMVDKYEYMQNFDTNNPQAVALTLAIVSGGIEGFVLYSSFAILMYFSSKRKKRTLTGVGSIVSFSIRDESLHSMAIVKLFHTYVKENKTLINTKLLEEQVVHNFRTLVDFEFKFIDLVLKEGDLEDLTKEDLKNYIYFLANKRLEQLGYNHVFPVTKSPLPWMDQFIFLREFAQFLETSVSSYKKIGEDNQLVNAFEDL